MSSLSIPTLTVSDPVTKSDADLVTALTSCELAMASIDHTTPNIVSTLRENFGVNDATVTRIASNAAAAQVTTASDTFVDLAGGPSITFTSIPSGPVMVQLVGAARLWNDGTPGTGGAAIGINIGGNIVRTPNSEGGVTSPIQANFFGVFCAIASAGSLTVKLQYSRNNTGVNNAIFDNRSLTARVIGMA